MGKRGPKPSGNALSAAERMRRTRERRRAQNAATASVAGFKSLQTLGNNSATGAVAEKLIDAYDRKDWTCILALALDLGYQPPPLDKDRLTLRFVQKSGDYTVLSMGARQAKGGLALMAWGASHPVVEKVTHNGRYNNYEVLTRDALTVVKAIHTGWKIDETRELTVWSNDSNGMNTKFRLIPAMLPYAVTVGKTRLVKGHLKWVKANTKGLWGRLSTQFSGDTYYFQDSADATLAKMMISDLDPVVD